MNRNAVDVQYPVVKNGGFTLMELLVGISILFIITTIAIPTFAEWRQSNECRQAARSIFQLLREARSTAISKNKECRVEFEPPAKRFGLRQGDRAVDTDWKVAPPISDWKSCPPGVHFSAKVKSIQFNTNGTANGGTITVRDRNMLKKYDIVVASTGRVRIK